jgi:menaquinone-specific isochorismate synthase
MNHNNRPVGENGWDGSDREQQLSADKRRLVSLSLPAPGLTVAQFLAHGRDQERFFWEDARDHISFAGFGAAANLFAWGDNRVDDIEQQARALFASLVLLREAPGLARPRLFGGFAFQDDFMPDNTWAAFHPAHFILPHYQLVQVRGESWLTINALIPGDEPTAAVLPELETALQERYRLLQETIVPPPERPAPPQVNYPLSLERWTEIINAARQQIAAGTVKKVVLSRMCELRFEQAVDIDRALAYLAQEYSDCYRFLFSPRLAHAFYGASPELLVKVDGRQLTTMAMAGSIARGETAAADEALGQTLLKNPKDRQEHDLVIISILGRLADVTSKLEIAPQPGLYKLKNIQHLFTPIRAQLNEASGVLPLVKLLHPTPALGGSPSQAALAFIRQAELAPRGWYAAPIGWLDYKLDGAFAVGIRSAVAQDRRLWLYAGAGIVAASDPDKEWQETTLKFRPMQEAVG